MGEIRFGASAWWLSALFCAASGCAVGSPVGEECRTGTDCESGACNDGICVDPTDGSGGGGGEAEGGSPAEGGAGAGGEGGSNEGGSGGAGGGLCSPNHDGVVTRAEVPIEPGLEAQFLVATDATWSTAGELVDGVRTWDMTETLNGDHTSLLETMPLGGKWFEDLFPGASYASRLSDSEELLGVFEITDDQLLLRGVVSPDDGLYRTELEYNPPVVVLAFPLEEGSTWETDATVSGLASGVFGVYFESYASVVDERGDVLTPFADFDALRVRIDLTRTVGALVTTQKTFAFVTECFGTIATLASQTNETGEEFNDLSEIKRLTP